MLHKGNDWSRLCYFQHSVVLGGSGENSIIQQFLTKMNKVIRFIVENSLTLRGG